MECVIWEGLGFGPRAQDVLERLQRLQAVLPGELWIGHAHGVTSAFPNCSASRDRAIRSAGSSRAIRSASLSRKPIGLASDAHSPETKSRAVSATSAIPEG